MPGDKKLGFRVFGFFFFAFFGSMLLAAGAITHPELALFVFCVCIGITAVIVFFFRRAMMNQRRKAIQSDMGMAMRESWYERLIRRMLMVDVYGMPHD